MPGPLVLWGAARALPAGGRFLRWTSRMRARPNRSTENILSGRFKSLGGGITLLCRRCDCFFEETSSRRSGRPQPPPPPPLGDSCAPLAVLCTTAKFRPAPARVVRQIMRFWSLPLRSRRNLRFYIGFTSVLHRILHAPRRLSGRASQGSGRASQGCGRTAQGCGRARWDNRARLEGADENSKFSV